MLYLATCPEPTCSVPAEVTDRFILPSTDGPVEYMKTYCARRHIFVLPTDAVPTRAPFERVVAHIKRG